MGIIEIGYLFLSPLVARYSSEYLRYDRSNYSILVGCCDREFSQCGSLPRSCGVIDFMAAIPLS